VRHLAVDRHARPVFIRILTSIQAVVTLAVDRHPGDQPPPPARFQRCVLARAAKPQAAKRESVTKRDRFSFAAPAAWRLLSSFDTPIVAHEKA
jgi:hypothetical protein